MLNNIKKQVNELMSEDNSGHGMDHINRVLELSLRFAEKENANVDVVALIALLHDVDDYKLFGVENANNLTNARIILNQCNISNDITEQVLMGISTIGYSKRLKGIKPTTLEGMVVSDADMCDAMGATGIIREYQYCLKYNKIFFDREIYPNIDEDMLKNCSETCVCHFFEKLLKLKELMLTKSGKKEAIKRHQLMVDFLYELFEEENAQEWILYLDKYLKDENIKIRKLS